jgi:methionyl-tRNA formyltransferase
VAIGELDSWQLARKLDRVTLALLRDVVRSAAAGAPLTGLPQDESEATWAPEPTDDALRVDWSWPTERVLRRIRALSPVPGLALCIHGRDFFVTRAEPASRLAGGLEPGEAALDERRAVCVATGDGGIRIVRAVPAEAPEPAAPPNSDAPLELSAISDWLGL